MTWIKSTSVYKLIFGDEEKKTKEYIEQHKVGKFSGQSIVNKAGASVAEIQKEIDTYGDAKAQAEILKNGGDAAAQLELLNELKEARAQGKTQTEILAAMKEKMSESSDHLSLTPVMGGHL